MSTAVTLFHVSTFCLFMYVTYFLQVRNRSITSKSEDAVIKVMHSYSKRFLTNWTFGVQTVYFGACLIGSFFSLFSFSQTLSTKIRSATDYLFTAVATPMAFTVSVFFWSLYLVDRELVFPKALDLVIPVWINHCIHSFNSVVAIIDMFLINHKFPSWRSAIKGISLYLILYAICFFVTYFQSDVWLYPVFKEINWPMRIAFVLSTLAISISMYAATKGLQYLIWGSNSNMPEKSKKNKHKKK